MTDSALARQSMGVGHPARPSHDPAPVDFDAIYRDEIAYVWRSLQRLGVRPSDLEDIAHDVFVVVYRRLSTYDSSRPLRPWLFGISLRVSKDHRRRARNTEIPSDAIEVVDDRAVPAQRAADRDLVMSALAHLDLDKRAVLLMHDLDGFTAPEIAAALEIPLNTVYSRLRLARARFTASARSMAHREASA